MPGAKGKTWWSYLSLLAALAIFVPSVAWSCPMTGRIASTPAQVCPCAAASEEATPHADHGCCHKVPVPVSDTSGDGKHGEFFSAVTQVAKIKAPVSQHNAWDLQFAAILPQSHAFTFSQGATYPRQSSRLLLRQPFLALHSGRAPPF